MKRTTLLLLLGLSGFARAQLSGSDATAPVQPIAAVPYRGFTNAIVLENSFVRAVIVPAVGRLAELALLDSENPLRTDAQLDKGKSSDTNNWANYGGSWTWLAEQAKWAGAFGRGWPPPVFDSPAAEWTASAWKRADGAQFCRLQLSLGAPLHVRVTREFLLSRKSAKLQVSQRIDRVLESKVPVTLWNIAQIGNADEVVLPLDPGTELVPLYEQRIPSEYVTACTNAVVIAPREISENKVGSTSPRSWIAGRKGLLLLILAAHPGNAAGTYPDKGCRVEMFTSKPLGYTELETLSEERALAPGETLANTLTLELYRSPQPVTGCALATWTMQLLGEIPFPRQDDRPTKKP